MRKIMLQVLISMLICSGTWPLSKGQIPPVKLEPVGELEDYSYIQTECVFQDSRGLIWIGTNKGLDRWDGSRMMSYTKSPFDTISLIPNAVFSITEDKQGQLWFSNIENLFKLDLQSEAFEIIHCTADKPGWGIYSMRCSPSGSLLLGCIDGLYEYFIDRDSLTHIPLEDPDFNMEKDRFKQWIYAMDYDTSGVLWLASKQGLLHYDPCRGVLIPHYFNIPESIEGRIICFDLCPDQQGNIWLQDDGMAILKFNPLTNQLLYVSQPRLEAPIFRPDAGIEVDRMGKVWFGMSTGLWQHDPLTGLTAYRDPREVPTVIRDIMEDRQGNLFIATNQGVHMLDRKSEQIKTYSAKYDFHLGDGTWINNVIREGDTFWIGTFHRGLIHYHPGSGQVRQYRAGDKPGDLSSDLVSKVLKDGENRIWVMAGRELHRYDPQTDQFERFSFELTSFITDDDDGHFWISGTDYFLRFDPISLDTAIFRFKEPLPFLGANYGFIPFIRDSDGIFWLGGVNGLYRLDPGTGNWSLFSHEPGNSASLPVNDIRSLYCDRKMRLWVGTTSGLCQVLTHPGTDSISFDSDFLAEGTIGHSIFRILEDDAGNLWFGSMLGAYVLRNNGTLESFTYREGFPEVPSLIWMLDLDPDGSVYAGKVDFMKISPDFLKPNAFVPPVMITELRISGELVSPGENSPLKKSILFAENVELKHDKNFIRLDFTALNHTAPQRNRYRYILEGVDPDTVEAGTRNFAEYTNLAPGNYKFWVTGSNNTGLWNPEGTSLFIRVFPPWYKSQAALIAYFALLLLLIFGYLRFRIAKFRRDKAHLENQVADRTSELRRKNEQIVEMERLKTSFFTNVSHEIRTPLSLITGPLDNLLKQDHPDPKTMSWLSMIHRNGERLLQLVNQLLDISKLDSGKMKLVLQESDVTGHLRMLVNQYLSLAETKRIKYVLDVPRDEQMAWYDQEKVDKICTNLLSNAFKFTPEFGIITCRVKILEGYTRSARSPMLRIIIADTGPGIARSEREKIFERFYRAEGSLYEDAGGTGIGLSLTRDLAELMHGELVLKSIEGSGAIFLVTLPLGKDHLQEHEFILKAAEISSKREAAAPPKEDKFAEEAEKADPDIEVLIVEDNEDLRTFIRENLSASYKILEAEDGIRGLRMAQSKIPDLILTDVMMPRMDGMEICRALKTDERTSHIPVVMLTARSTSKEKIEGLEIGADDYIYKPFSMEELYVRIRNLLEQQERLKKKYSSYIDLGLSEMTVSSLDEQFLKKAIRIIEENLSDFEFDVRELQDKIAMSRSQLFRKMKALTGVSPVQLIKLMRLKLAASLIERGEGTITEILMSVGFSNPSYFARCFKEKFGVTPKAFQQVHIH